MRADNTKYNRAQQFLITYYPRALFELHSALSTRYVRRVVVCARQDLAQNVRNGLPACIEPEQTKPPQYSDIGHGFFTFLETGSSLARNNFFFRIMLYYTSYVIVISLYKTTNGYRFYRVRIFFRQQKLNISISFTDTRSQVRDLLDPSSVVRDSCVHP